MPRGITGKPLPAARFSAFAAFRCHRPMESLHMNARVIAKADVDPKIRRRRQCVSVLAFFAAAVIASLAASAVGQDPYKRVPTPKGFDVDANLKRARASLKSWAGDSDGLRSRHAKLAYPYATQYVPSRMTQADATPEITTLVEEVLAAIEVAQRRDNKAVADQLNKGFYQAMGKIAVGDFQPAARVAATMAIGRLNGSLGDLRTGQPPTPYNTLGALTALYGNKKFPEGVRAAALHGLHRFVSLTFHQLPQDKKDSLAGMMQQLLGEPAPAGRTPDAHAFMQRYAVDILDLIRPDDANIASALVTISSDRNRPGLIALHSAAKFGRSPVAAKAKVESPLDTLDQWTARAYRAFEGEVKRLQMFNQPREKAKVQPELPQDILAPAEEDLEVAGQDNYGEDMEEEGGYGEDMEEDGGYGEDMAEDGYGYGPAVVEEFEPQPAPVVATRRYLNHVLQQLHLGVTGSPKPGMPSQPGGLLAVADDASKAEIKTWVSKIEELLEKLNDKSLEEQSDFVTELEALTKDLRDMAGKAAKEPVAAPAGEGEMAQTDAGNAEILVNR